MRIYILSRGPLAEKVVNNLVEHGLADMIVGIHEYPESTHGMIDDLETVMPEDPPECDLLLALFLHPAVAPVIPRVARRTGAKEVLVPIEDWHLMPEGLRRQLADELHELGIRYEFPKPFCQLDGSSHPLINQFAIRVGRPRMDLEQRSGVIIAATATRDTPCGSARFVAGRLIGTDASESRDKAARAHLDYPCLAGMDPDPVLKREIMQVATGCLCDEVDRALKVKGKRA